MFASVKYIWQKVTQRRQRQGSEQAEKSSTSTPPQQEETAQKNVLAPPEVLKVFGDPP